MDYVLLIILIYIAIVVTYIAIPKKQKIKEKEEKPKRTAYSKSAYSTPLKTYKEYDQFKDKKSKLYAPIKMKGKGVEIKDDQR